MSQSSADRQRPSAIRWYFQRFKSMQVREIPHRLIELLLRRASKYSWLTKRDVQLPANVFDCPLPTLPLNIGITTEELNEAEARDLIANTDDLCSGKYFTLGQQWPEGQITDWSVDPVSGKHWPWQRYTHDIPRRHGKGPGDVKFVWELSRLQHLQILAIAARVMGRRDARRICVDILERWIDENPPYIGLGYASGIELASRIVSILVVVTFLGSQTFGPSLTKKIWKCLCCHGRFIARFPSLYSSANNHLVAESAALFLLGSAAPEIPEAGRWRSIGWKRLTIEADRQVLPDGAGAEQSPSYLASTLEWFLVCRNAFVSLQQREQTELDDALIRGAAFISSLADTQGNVPMFGDRDDGVVLRPKLDEQFYQSSLVAAIACCLEAPKVMHPAFRPDIRKRMLTTNAIAAGECIEVSKTFENGGYTVMRAGHSSNELYLLFDHGPLGFASTAAHGHADALSIWLHVDGKPVLVDFGTYRYHADRGFRVWARGTAAHNTIEINGASQSSMTGPFNWGQRANSRLLSSGFSGPSTECSAEHDGYQEKFGITHRRSISMTEERRIKILDSLAGAGTHDVLVSFHFAQDLQLLPTSNNSEFRIVRSNTDVGLISGDPGLAARVTRQEGTLTPGPGVISRSYNDLTPACSLTFSGRTELSQDVETTILVA